MKLSCIIVDDEPLALELIKHYVEQTSFLSLAACCASATQALEKLREIPVDVIFLDIQMPGLSGMELSACIDNRIKIIFTTAFEEYALQGYKADALDYLLKPISYPEFLRAADKALQWFARYEEKNNNPLTKKNIFVRSDYKLLKIALEQICYIEGLKDYVKIYLEGEKLPVISLVSMKTLEETLEEPPFIRVHRSYIVNTDKISVIEHNRIIFGKNYIPISDTYKEKFMEFITKKTIK